MDTHFNKQYQLCLKSTGLLEDFQAQPPSVGLSQDGHNSLQHIWSHLLTEGYEYKCNCQTSVQWLAMKGNNPPDTSYLSVSFTKFVAKIYFCESLVYYISFMMAYLQ